MFVISWRNPDPAHASWDFDTYVDAVLDALEAVEEITGSAQTVLGGVCSGGILASMTAAYLAGIGQQDRLAALCLAVTAFDSQDAETVSALVRRAVASRGQGDIGTQGIPRRADVGRGVRVAAARGPGVELLGEQLPAGQAAPGVRHPVLELRHHPDDRRTARRLRRPGDGRFAGTSPGPSPSSACRSTSTGSPWTPTWWPASPTTSPRGRTATEAPSSSAGDPLRAVDQWSHRCPGQPARQPQGVLPHQRRHDVRRQRCGSRAPISTRAAGGPTSACGSTSAAASSVQHPRRSGRTA